MGKHALVVATISGFIKPFEMNDISILQDKGYTVHVATKIAQEDDVFFQERGVIPHHIDFKRFPFKSSNFKAIGQLRQIIRDNNIELVHCHTPVGGVIARLAAKKFRKKGCKIIYTVHGLQFYQGASKKDWLIYYPIEKWLSRYSDAIITINTEDYQLVKNKFKNLKTYYIPGVGVDLSRFSDLCIDRELTRKEFGLTDKDTMVLSVGEVNDNKNQQIIIYVIDKINDAGIKYYIAGSGPMKEKLRQQADESGLEDRVFLLGSRKDVDILIKSADIFVHPSKREGLSVALMEAMAGGLPVVCSEIRGNVDLIDNNQGGYLCKVDSVDEYIDAITKLKNDKDLRRQFADYNQKKIQEFSLNIVDKKMRKIYAEILD